MLTNSINQTVPPSLPLSPSPNLPLSPILHPALQLIAAQPALFARQGYVAQTWRKKNNKTYGPYYSLAFRINGRQKSIYLGRESRLVQEVRQKLAVLREPRQKLRLFDTLRRQAKASLRIQKIQTASLLPPFGLRMKGFEIRGWRYSPLRRFLASSSRYKKRFSLPKPLTRFQRSILIQSRLAKYEENRATLAHSP